MAPQRLLWKNNNNNVNHDYDTPIESTTCMNDNTSEPPGATTPRTIVRGGYLAGEHPWNTGVPFAVSRVLSAGKHRNRLRNDSCVTGTSPNRCPIKYTLYTSLPPGVRVGGLRGYVVAPNLVVRPRK